MPRKKEMNSEWHYMFDKKENIAKIENSLKMQTKTEADDYVDSEELLNEKNDECYQELKKIKSKIAQLELVKLIESDVYQSKNWFLKFITNISFKNKINKIEKKVNDLQIRKKMYVNYFVGVNNNAVGVKRNWSLSAKDINDSEELSLKSISANKKTQKLSHMHM